MFNNGAVRTRRRCLFKSQGLMGYAPPRLHDGCISDWDGERRATWAHPAAPAWLLPPGCSLHACTAADPDGASTRNLPVWVTFCWSACQRRSLLTLLPPPPGRRLCCCRAAAQPLLLLSASCRFKIVPFSHILEQNVSTRGEHFSLF